ncbi:MAG TPA: terminase gpA endonuclease subunit [Oligoflexus sp.]|uniref:terminase gpA endonuclease subunit n=1 Tax=Oligoflexus sp. TaxID=1971216 RepID=UPI002D5666A9|nr:terminase gpA endonuclease subunit [Oligoflexus sp.]HYX35786.1 terminase gpA endonuclease subunit [Oligoflexus sp.]
MKILPRLEIEDCLGSAVRSFKAGIRPVMKVGIKEYCEKNFILPEGTPRPGPISFEDTWYMIDILRNLEDDSGVEEVRIRKGRQLGLTILSTAWMLWGAAVSPAAAMVVFPTRDSKQKFSKQKLAPILRRCKDLIGKIGEARQKEKDTLDIKTFPGGFINIASAKSSSELRSQSVRRLVLDEQSAYDTDCQGEGDPSAIALGCTSTFQKTRKILRLSTPTIKGVCPITRDVEDTQKLRYHVPCRGCGEFVTIEWERMRGPHETASGECEWHAPCCDHAHRNIEKVWLIRSGKWIATAEDKTKGRVKGYILSALYAAPQFFSWDDAWNLWVEAQKDLQKMKAFHNNVLAEAWEDPADSIDIGGVEKLLDDSPVEPLNPGIYLITAGIDVHPAHLDFVVRGWGRGQESWVIDYGVISGDADQKETWDRLMRRLERRWDHPLGFDLEVAAACFDTGGHNTQSVHDNVGPLFHRNFICIKGMPGDATPVIGRQTLNNEFGVRVYPVGTNTTKARVFAGLSQSISRVRQFEEGKIESSFGHGFCHFPRRLWEDKETRHFFTQLIAPRARHKAVNGEWRTVYETTSGTPDHAFDCYRYALAAFYWLGTDIDQLADTIEKEVGRANA